MHIVAPEDGDVTETRFPQFLVERPHDDAVVIDLNNLRSIDPAGLVTIAIAVSSARRSGRAITLTVPRDNQVTDLLSAAGLGDILRMSGAPGLDPGRRRRTDLPDYVEMVTFAGEPELETRSEYLAEVLKARCWPRVAPAYTAIFELGLNVIQHSGDTAGYVAVSHRFGSAVSNERLSIAVGDAGMGLRASLRAQHDSTAIRNAVRKYHSTVNAPGRGRGIASVNELAGRCRGHMTIVSGQACGYFDRGHWDPRISHIEAPFSGTVVQATLGVAS